MEAIREMRRAAAAEAAAEAAAAAGEEVNEEEALRLALEMSQVDDSPGPSARHVAVAVAEDEEAELEVSFQAGFTRAYASCCFARLPLP